MIKKSRKTLHLMVDGFFLRYKTFIFVLLIVYFIAAHYWFLGFNTWDGLSYRIPPIVEFVQHGNLGGWKFNYLPAQHFYPFLEWVHVPFLKLLGLRGLYFSFSLVLLPLSIASVYAFVRELTSDLRWAMYSALAYIAIPFVNTQPFSGYIDFAVIGALAFFLYALLRVLRSDRSSFQTVGVFSLATFLFSLSRQHTPYLAALLFGVLTVWFFAPWDWTTQAKDRRWSLIHRMPIILAAFVIGIMPAAILHISRYLEFGSPIFPLQFKFYGGLIAPTWNEMLVNFRHGWVWPGGWPRDFFDSYSFGAGLFFWMMLVTLPVLDRNIDRDTGFFLLLFGAIAILVRDFWLPRYSMTLVLAVVISVAGALSWLASKGPSWAYTTLFLAVLIHLGRPIYDAYNMTQMGHWYTRVNISGSPLFIDGETAPGELKLYPDLEVDFWVVHPLENSFSLLLYGRDLSNRIIGGLEPSEIEENCFVNKSPAADRETLIVDQLGRLATISNECKWVCEYSAYGRCLAGRLIPAE